MICTTMKIMHIIPIDLITLHNKWNMAIIYPKEEKGVGGGCKWEGEGGREDWTGHMIEIKHLEQIITVCTY